MLIAIVVFGIYPNLLFDVTDATVADLAASVASAIGAG
jgi:NADH:ubiquinone oxidoreductase subunit 4 (subunit M)